MNPAPPVTSTCLLKLRLLGVVATNQGRFLILLTNEHFVRIDFLGGLRRMTYIEQVHTIADDQRHDPEKPPDQRKNGIDPKHVPNAIDPAALDELRAPPRIYVQKRQRQHEQNDVQQR